MGSSHWHLYSSRLLPVWRQLQRITSAQCCIRTKNVSVKKLRCARSACVARSPNCSLLSHFSTNLSPPTIFHIRTKTAKVIFIYTFAQTRKSIIIFHSLKQQQPAPFAMWKNLIFCVFLYRYCFPRQL